MFYIERGNFNTHFIEKRREILLLRQFSVREITASQTARKITALEVIRTAVVIFREIKRLLNAFLIVFGKAEFSQIESDEEESQALETIDANAENWILIDPGSSTPGALSDKGVTDMQTKMK